ncbi:ABC transporter ATP-binding protein [Paracandidimonas soli]|uniref:NitT/TauT family transport system ATP-binding protein n=1 Tax=Paracandidimonas soli TaxID=1917182 RepID=A0A4V2VQM5_9BURK|nr:ABC transporter ATP-binding protein [Paracandidimonas soli]TCU95189.1 NitT/TauT family transport system ATP-binding protein [Paracandidimonas soli]
MILAETPAATSAGRRPQRLARPALRFDSVGLSYDGRPVLADISFSMQRGELISVLGPSGCGKTTMLNIAAGFLRPTSGVALVNDREIVGPGPDRGVVFQSYALFDWMTVAQNIIFSLTCAGRPEAERRETASRMAELVGLAGFESAYPYQLSGGMRQRCGLARVLAANPSVMLMDEPFAAVDVQTRETLQEEILRIRRQTQCSVMFITHSIDEAVFLSDRVFLMRKGQLGRFDEFRIDLPEPRESAENRLHPSYLAVREEIYRAMREDGH